MKEILYNIVMVQLSLKRVSVV